MPAAALDQAPAALPRAGISYSRAADTPAKNHGGAASLIAVLRRHVFLDCAGPALDNQDSRIRFNFTWEA